MHNPVAVSDEISLICTVLKKKSAEKSVNYQLLTWQIEYSIDPDNSNLR